MIADDDPVAQRLREAVWADPAADAPRMVYADYLLERGDPLGELIALQLERARIGGVIDARERELAWPHGLRTLGGMREWLSDWRISRGFLEAAGVMPSMPVAAAHHRSWATLEEVTALDVHPIFDNPHLRAETLHTTGAASVLLSRRPTPLPFRSLAGWQPHVGLDFAWDALAIYDAPGALDRVRALGLSASHFESPSNTHPILTSRLITQLEHLDLTFTSIQLDALRRWRTWAESSRLARFSVHVPLDRDTLSDISESVGSNSAEPSNFLYCEVAAGADHLVLQLDEATWQQAPETALTVIAEAAGERTRVVVEDLARGTTGRDDDHSALISALRGRFEVSIAPGAMRRRAP